MSKRFPIVFGDDEHKALKVAAAQAEVTMTDFIKAAVAEKIARLTSVAAAPTQPPLPIADAAHSEHSVLVQANADKPTSPPPNESSRSAG